MHKRKDRDTRTSGQLGGVARGGLLEAMEPRVLLSNPGPLPALADFEDPTNPAIRVSTRWGDIDIELFASQVPELVNQFLLGRERGLFSDQTFFHRVVPGVVLQGGLFAYAMNAGLGAIPANFPVHGPVGSGRANTERTVALGQVIDDVPMTQSAFVINLGDNSNRFGAATSVVFGRIIDDRSWGVAQTISSLEVADLSQDPQFVGLWAGSFHNVPVTAPYTPPNEDGDPGTPITNDLLVTTYDVAVLKAPGASDVYRYTMYEPEGFLNSGIREFVPIENPNDEPVYYELNVRFEAGPRLLSLVRDDLVERGVIAPHSRGGVTLQLGGDSVPSGVLQHDQPFAFELRSTLPLAASLSHYDLGSNIAMPFTGEVSTTWYFPHTVKEAGVHDFLVWYNPGLNNASVTLTLIDANGQELAPIVFQTERLRRGGINFNDQAVIPEGVYAVRVESTEPIVVTRSHYATSGPPRERPEGYSEVGAAGAPSTIGVVPLAADPGMDPIEGEAPTFNITFFNPGETETVIRLDFYGPDGLGPNLNFPAILIVGAGRAASFQHAIPQDPSYVLSLVYTSGAPVYASYWTARSEGIYGGAVPIVAGTEHHFAEGFTDPDRAAPNELEESLHIFNPNHTDFGTTNADANVSITFRFTDGFELTVNRVVGAGFMSRVHISGLEGILEQGREHGRYFYSVVVNSDVPVVVQMLHTDVSLGAGGLQGGGFVLSGSVLGGVVRLDELGGG